MAFLTDYSYRQLIERIEIQNLERIDQQFFKTNIYDNDYLYYLFNQLDLKKLFAEKIILSKDKAYVLVHKEVPERKDNQTYVLEIKGNVKYHKDNKCEALNRGFKNFYMPETVVQLAQENSEKHEKIVKEIRYWFEKNNYTVYRYEAGEINDKILTTDFNRTFPKKFDIQPILDEINSGKSAMSLAFKNLVYKEYLEARSVKDFNTLKTGITCGDKVGFIDLGNSYGFMKSADSLGNCEYNECDVAVTTSVKKWERINYSEYRKDIFYSYTLHEGVEHHSWEENRYDFETGKIQVIRHSDCMGRRTGIFYPSEQAYLEIEYDSLNRKKKGFVYTLDNEYTRDRERYYSYDNANNLILIEEVLRGFDLEEYDTNHRFLERFVHYKYDGVNRLVGKRSVNYNDSVLNELEIEYNSKGDIIAKEQSNSTNFKRRIKYNFAGYPKWISTNYKSIDIHGNSIAKSFIWKLKYNKSHQLIGLKESLNYSSEPEIRHNYSIVYN